MTDQMIASTLERLRLDAKASVLVLQAAQLLEDAALLNGHADLREDGPEAQRFITESLEHLTRRQGLVLCERVRERAAQLGWQVATYEIAPEAKGSRDDEPVVFITGNAYMPPLRDYGISEDVWQLAHELPAADLWASYVEALEARVDELRVALACPDYDNALYVVDLERFEHVDEDEAGDTLSSEWRRLPSD